MLYESLYHIYYNEYKMSPTSISGGGNLLTGGRYALPPVMIFATPTYRGGGHLLPSYKQRVQSLSRKFRQSQIKAAVKVNRKMLAFYWELGRDIVG